MQGQIKKSIEKEIDQQLIVRLKTERPDLPDGYDRRQDELLTALLKGEKHNN